MVGTKQENLSFKTKLGTAAKDFKRSIMYNIEHVLAKDEYSITELDWYKSVALAVRDRLMNLWNKTQKTYYDEDSKRVYYLSLEFLMGRALGNSLMNLDAADSCHQAIKELGHTFAEAEEKECDAGLGNGGLGRLAACFLDSMATMQLPGYGYGLRYEYGIFTQVLRDGKQIETPDHWLQLGNIWEIERPESMYKVQFGGQVREYKNKKGHILYTWEGGQEVMAMAYDTPIPGYKNETVNTLRLWAAKSTEEFDFDYFNHGNYVKAVEEKNISENITRVLYPNDNINAGKELRLKQQYFFVSATLQDILRRYKKERKDFNDFSKKVAIQLNDTHPSLAIPELMRILVDIELLSWEAAWKIVTNTFSYTNHTVLPEALEKWPVSMFGRVLPRHLQIIYEINRRFLYEVAHQFPGDQEIITRMSLIEEGKEKYVRMAHLAIVGSYSVNGVAKLHSSLLKKNLFKDFASWDPKKFNNKTNGITQRRWLKLANPMLSKHIGEGWVTDLYELKKLQPLANNAAFRAKWRDVKYQNKVNLSKIILAKTGVTVNPNSLFDVQVKRIHEYKRQLLNVLHIIYLYNKIKNEGTRGFVPRTFIFGGKAAPGYFMAKSIIQLILAIGDVINNDQEIKDAIKVVFLPNYGVSLAEHVFPGADLSEQISTAGMEASGTGNMKFALNGALTIGTLDGANIEIKEEVGDENIFIFGLTEEEVMKKHSEGYNPRDYYENNQSIREVMDMLASDYFSPFETGLFLPIFDNLINSDYYLHFADFEAYVACQERVAKEYKDQEGWTKKAILNVARTGKFSSDRTIMEYAEQIWKVKPIKPQIEE